MRTKLHRRSQLVEMGHKRLSFRTPARPNVRYTSDSDKMCSPAKCREGPNAKVTLRSLQKRCIAPAWMVQLRSRAVEMIVFVQSNARFES
jgi:hypothetical protein